MTRSVERKYRIFGKSLDERTRRIWAAAEADEIGYGGLSIVFRATGLAISTIRHGRDDIDDEVSEGVDVPRRIRRSGAGRKQITEKDPTVMEALDLLLEPTTRGDPMCGIRWTCKSLHHLEDALKEQHHSISYQSIRRLLHSMKYSLQGNRKTDEGGKHPDRDAQFQHIHETATSFQQQGDPVISVDTKKKELVGNFKNSGKEWMPEGKPTEVKVYDFVDKNLGKAIPYGVYDLTRNEGFVSVGIDHDTAEFAVESIRRWWKSIGKKTYAQSRRLYITADGGGSNASRSRLWKKELQKFANENDLSITVSHFPPGTSKWNKIEHKMFSHISMNWRGQPLLSRELIVNLISHTTTRNGLTIHAQLDTGTYAKGKSVSKQEFEQLALQRNQFHGEWNYTISPQYFE
ncbi:MAG: ISAzo13 family transposase [bacterium]|nr:ISAzo13 family transposase [bacterium]